MRNIFCYVIVAEFLSLIKYLETCMSYVGVSTNEKIIF